MNVSTRRTLATMVLLGAATASLNACSGSDSEGTPTTTATNGATTNDVTSQACRLAAVTDASLAGPRDNVRSGAFYPEDAQSYAVAIASLGSSVSAEGEVDANVTSAITNMVGGYSRSKSFIEDAASSSSYNNGKARALIGFEERALSGLNEACPNLGD